MSQTLCQTLHAFHNLFPRATHLRILNLHGGVGIQTQAFLTVLLVQLLALSSLNSFSNPRGIQAVRNPESETDAAHFHGFTGQDM